MNIRVSWGAQGSGWRDTQWLAHTGSTASTDHSTHMCPISHPASAVGDVAGDTLSPEWPNAPWRLWLLARGRQLILAA
jgi:hypothetical protein